MLRSFLMILQIRFLMIITIDTVVSSLMMLSLINNFFVDGPYMIDLYSLSDIHDHVLLWLQQTGVIDPLFNVDRSGPWHNS